MVDKITSYCDCSGVDPVEFEKVEENEYVIARCTKCGRITNFRWNVWYGILFPEEVDSE